MKKYLLLGSLALLKAGICCKILVFLAAFGAVSTSPWFSMVAGGHIVPVLITWPVILYLGYDLSRQECTVGWGFWLNGVTLIASLALFAYFVISNYLPMTKQAGFLIQIVIPFVVWPVILLAIFFAVKRVVFTTSTIPARLIYSVGLIALCTTVYFFGRMWLEEVFKAAQYQCG